MARVKLVLAYVGTGFSGWQIQLRRDGRPAPRTVQGELEAALYSLLGVNARVHGAGRTDAGVHADMQTAHFDVPEQWAGLNWPLALRRVLPPDIGVLSAAPVPQDFHARFSALGKTYRYSFCLERHVAFPKLSPFVWAAGPLDLARMDDAARGLLGEHDFAAFQNSGNRPGGNTLRRLDSARRFPLPLPPGMPEDCAGLYWIWEFTGNGFLKQMVRNIMGFLAEVGRGRLRAEEAARFFATGRRGCFPTAPARGLSLSRVIYAQD